MSVRCHARHSGFTLVEVMVALLVISVGLLGIAKMQALALASTASARTRSLAALQAASLAATMQADRSYWSAITASPSLTITVPASGAFSPNPADPNLVVPSGTQSGCSSSASPCTAGQLAAQDLTDWTTSLHTALTNSSATLICTPGAAANSATCTLTINWTDHLIALNTAANTTSTAAQVSAALQNMAANTSSYQLFIQP